MAPARSREQLSLSASYLLMMSFGSAGFCTSDGLTVYFVTFTSLSPLNRFDGSNGTGKVSFGIAYFY